MSASLSSLSSARRLNATQWAMLAVAASTLLHVAVIGRVALSVDEAHYALYGLHPALSYFDHPPLVGWLQALPLRLFGEGDWVVRLWPVLLSPLAALLLYRLTRELLPAEGPAVAAGAVLLLQSAVMVQLLGVALVPELPLLVLGLAALLALKRALDSGALHRWLTVGLLFGLAGLAKYTAVLLVATAVALLLTERRLVLLRAPGPWFAALIALLLVSPVLWWNQQHDWISLRYQFGHGAPDRGWEPVRFLRAQAGQLAAYGPLLFVGGLAGLVAGWRERGRPGVRMLLAALLPPLVVFGWASGFEETLPHWTLLAWALMAPLAALWLHRRWQRRSVRSLVVAGGGLSLLLVLLIHGQLFSPWMPYAAYRHPLGDLYGWDAAAERASAVAREQGLPRLFVENWTHGSRIAWYARPLPVRVLDRRTDQFDLWFGAPQRGDDGLLVRWVRPGRTYGDPPFDRCSLAETVEPRLEGEPVHRFELWACRGYRGRP